VGIPSGVGVPPSAEIFFQFGLKNESKNETIEKNERKTGRLKNERKTARTDLWRQRGMNSTSLRKNCWTMSLSQSCQVERLTKYILRNSLFFLIKVL
jgi:hypothetical protein